MKTSEAEERRSERRREEGEGDAENPVDVRSKSSAVSVTVSTVLVPASPRRRLASRMVAAIVPRRDSASEASALENAPEENTREK